MNKLSERKQFDETLKTQRFDETLKILLIITTTTMSFSIGLYKEVLDRNFFIEFFISFVFSVIFWCFFNLIGGSLEYLGKLYAWHFLIFNMVISFARLLLGSLKIPIWMSIPCFVIIMVPTIFVKNWLEKAKAIPSREYNLPSKNFLYIIGIFTILLLINTLEPIK